MRTTGTMTEEVYRFAVHYQAKEKLKHKPRDNPDAKTAQIRGRLYYVIMLFPILYFLVGFCVFRLPLVVALITAILWFVSFFIAGWLYHRTIVSVTTKRPRGRHLDEPVDYAIENGWLVIRTPVTETRMSLARVVGLVITPVASFVEFGDLGLKILPFGSASDRADQTAFLEALKKEIPSGKSA